jgi:hypothetical protein
MSDPRYRVERRLDAPPDAVIAAIRDAIRTTKTTEIPLDLRKRTITGLSGKVRGRRFTAGLAQLLEGDLTEMAGHVIAAEDGGSLVQASVADDRHAPAVALVVIGIAGVMAFTGQPGAAWVAGAGVVIGIVAWMRNATGAINHDEARFLVDWLNGVLDRMPASPSPGDPGARNQPAAPPAAS